MRSRLSWSISGSRWLALVALAGALLLAACGSKGVAPALGQPVTVKLDSAGPAKTAGTITLTPVYAVRLQVFYRGQQVPLTGAQTPALLRSGGCDGALIAALSDGALPPDSSRATPATPAPTPVVTLPTAGGDGMNVAVQPGADLYVVVMDRPHDAHANVVACGHPLSERRQYFDLYPPDVGSNGTARGLALMDPIVATRVDVRLRSSDPAVQPTGWEVASASCTGVKAGGGTMSGTSGQSSGIIFAPLDTHNWWAAVTQSDGERICTQVSG